MYEKTCNRKSIAYSSRILLSVGGNLTISVEECFSFQLGRATVNKVLGCEIKHI